MKQTKQFLALVALVVLLSSCYAQTMVVGQGAQGNTTVSQWNHYLIGGLAPIDVSKPEEMAAGKEDYTVETKHSFVNGLLNVITFGIYTPTTTTVKY
ncbi:Bor family protein [Nonlabens agnitus]|uniref:Bor protein n=1 Tax=Nonlabens agnitus TaxID=870484 RepID=A0A2S9WUR1_9FLAO|nr:Bor family protein [Nonlabens agnitus]PRP67217.1 hypothetical protein BST86_08945 [Nonlabens agnitus]